MAPPSTTSFPSTAQLPSASSGVAYLAVAGGTGESNPDVGMPDSQGGSDSVPSAELIPHSRSPPHRNPVDSDADEPMQEGETEDVVDAGASLDITAQVVPASFPQSAVHQPSNHAFFVGIPAWSQHLADDRYTRDGYGGLEVVQCVDGLTAVDLQNLAALADQGGDVDALTLRPRSDRPLDLAELEGMLNWTLIRREFASILSHYSPDSLAQKVFASTTFLKRLLAKFRQLRTQVDPSNDTAVQNMLNAQSETTRVRADYATLHEFYWGEANRLQEQLDAARHHRQSDLRGVLAEHELEARDLREEVVELRSQAENLRLLGRTRSGSRRLNVPKLINFLDRDQTRVNDNWKRLQNLLERFRDGVAPEKSWSTLIAIAAVQARPPSKQLMILESDVREIMKNEPVGSIAMVSGDVMTHNLFPPSALADMLASMMFWNRLDESFWTKYVQKMDADVRVTQEVMDDASSEHDDTQHDANYNPDDDVDNQDDDESVGFPDYAPNKAGGIQPLKQRFILADVQALLATEPWTTMFENRVKRLVLHSYSALAPRARMALDKYIRFMEENASKFWHGGHWFAIDTSTQGDADMQRERKR
ncbi:hypothetical protein PHMEG_00029081 [Phytophthora megakarya]|uniref:Uncharacterized protein n=1 Tax=Phytophthora megakarya TaxID=4795 RepID=A0A225V3I6_9STRA|nr:hypothetical protein PHMEG_00029081 [Phytophthora megakarya]